MLKVFKIILDDLSYKILRDVSTALVISKAYTLPNMHTA